jgi:hypothetical protein
MNSELKHPDIERFDELRAGLLDGRPRLQTELRAHLATCELCRRRADWAPVTGHFKAVESSVAARLNQARTQALDAGQTRRHHLHLTRGPLAIAASVAFVAVLAVHNMPWNQPAQSPAPTVQAMTDNPDLYEDIDFYLWLADHQKGSGESGQADDQRS